MLFGILEDSLLQKPSIAHRFFQKCLYERQNEFANPQKEWFLHAYMCVFDCLCKSLFQLLTEDLEKYWLTTKQQKEMIKIFFQFNQLDGSGYRYVFNTLKLIDPYMENFISRKLKLTAKLDLIFKEKI